VSTENMNLFMLCHQDARDSHSINMASKFFAVWHGQVSFSAKTLVNQNCIC